MRNDALNTVNTKAGSFEEWKQIYQMLHFGTRADRAKAQERALELMDALKKTFIKQMVTSQSRNYLYTFEDLMQSMDTMILVRLQDYNPYVIQDGEQKEVLGSTYLYYSLKEVCSDFSRGGDGMGTGIPKYWMKQYGQGPEVASIDEDLLSADSEVSRALHKSAICSAEEQFFADEIDEEFLAFARYLYTLPDKERRIKLSLYQGLRDMPRIKRI